MAERMRETAMRDKKKTRDVRVCEHTSRSTDWRRNRNKQLIIVVFHDALIDDHLATRGLAAAAAARSATVLQATRGATRRWFRPRAAGWQHANVRTHARAKRRTTTRAVGVQNDCSSSSSSAEAPHDAINRIKSLHFDGNATWRRQTALPLWRFETRRERSAFSTYTYTYGPTAEVQWLASVTIITLFVVTWKGKRRWRRTDKTRRYYRRRPTFHQLQVIVYNSNEE